MSDHPVAGPPEADPLAEKTSPSLELRWRLNRQIHVMLDHLWGPTGSIILHILILVILIRFVTGISERRMAEIEVMMIEPETANFEELQKELESIKETIPDILPTDTALPVEQPPEVRPTVMNPMEDFAELNIRADVRSPLVMKGLFAGRTAEGRAAMLARYAPPGRDKALDAAVWRALRWLKEQQLPDGSWEGEGLAKCKTAMTGLALLTFLSHGETTHSEEFGPTVERAIKFLLEDQRENGRFRSEGPARVSAYAHGIATYALGEAYALTRVAAIRPALEKALEVIIRSQQPTGGHTYEMQPHRTRRDTSIMSWMSQAMKAGYLAGVEVPGLKEAMDQIASGLKMAYHPERRLFAYAIDPSAADPGVTPRWQSNTMQAVLCLQLLGHGGAPEARAGAETISTAEINWNGPGVGLDTLYNWYYHTQAMFHTGGKAWDRWNRAFSAAYLAAQNADGSWTPAIGREVPYGPVYGTCFAALTLMVYYRFLPTYQPIQIEELPTQQSEDDVKVDIIG